MTVIEPPDPQDAEGAVGAGELNTGRRWLGRGILAVGILLLLSVAWVSFRTFHAYRHLNAAAEQVSALQQQVKNLDAIDITKTTAAVNVLRSEAGDAVSATSDPLYRLAAHLPWAGPNLRAITDIASTVDGLATTTAPSLVKVAEIAQPGALAPKNGVIDVAPIAAASATLQAANAEVTAAGQRIDHIDRQPLAGPMVRALNTFQNKLASLSTTTSTAARIARLAPPMLGADGVRKYLVVFQNLAEPRASGGLFGSYALMTVDQGKLTLSDQGSVSRDIGTANGKFTPALPVPASLPTALYGQLPGAYSTDTNLTPDFPTAAELLAKMFTIRHHVAVDGVLSLDPVALSYLLEGAKPIPVGHNLELTSTNVTRILLSTVYSLYPDAADVPAREIFLADATERAFTTVTHSGASTRSVLTGLARAANQHRLLLWSAHPAEQTDIRDTDLAKPLPSTDGATPTVGVFRNDGVGGKLGYYAGGSGQLTSGACDGAGRRALDLTVHLTYSAPASGLPPYVLGYARAGAYVLRTNLLVFAPLDGTITSLTVNGKSVPVIWSTENGRKVGMITVDLRPKQEATVVGKIYVVASASIAAEFKPALVMTPGVTNWKTTTSAFPAC